MKAYLLTAAFRPEPTELTRSDFLELMLAQGNVFGNLEQAKKAAQEEIHADWLDLLRSGEVDEEEDEEPVLSWFEHSKTLFSANTEDAYFRIREISLA